MESEQEKKKRKLFVFATTVNCELSHTDLITFSYLLYQDRFKTKPTNRSVARHTGIGEHTVAACISRLTECGLYKDGRAILPDDKLDHFQLSATNPKEHRSQWPYFFKSYVRAENSPLTVAAVSIYSYMLQKGRDKFSPPHGWTPAYIAKCLRMDIDTAKRCMTLLHEQGVAVYQEDPFVFRVKVPNKLNEHQLAMFADGKEIQQHKVAGSCGLLDDADEEEVRPLTVEDRLCKSSKTLRQYGFSFPCNTTYLEALRSVGDSAIMDSGDLAPDWKEIINKELRLRMVPHDDNERDQGNESVGYREHD